MISDKDITEAEKNVNRYLEDGLLIKNPSNKSYAGFYLDNAKTSLQVAQLLLNISIDKELKKRNGLPESFECFLWVVVISYYSMFYMGNAALSKLGLKVGEKIAHKITQDALHVYFIKNNRLAKYLLEEYIETKTKFLI